MPSRLNVADRLATIARRTPQVAAVVSARRGKYSACTFHELEHDSAALARGLVQLGVAPGHRIVLLVKPGIQFVKLVFALLRSGATTVLIDPGMGRRHLVKCLADCEPDGFVAVSAAQAVRALLRNRFPHARLNVTVGRRWFWGGATYAKLLRQGRSSRQSLPSTEADQPAAIIFTSGSTGPPKGVLYTHQMFDTQVSEIERAYELGPGGVDLACFALFGLFNSAMGVTTVFPEMDFSRPASADPAKLLAAANKHQVTQAFASPAVWDKLSRWCKASGERIPTLRKVFSCGAPVPAAVLARTLAMVHPEAEMHTPYGATEALPVATIEAKEVLNHAAGRTAQGAGVCVGRKFATIDWRVVRITDDPLRALADAEELPVGEIGELVVRGPQVSPRYLSASSAALSPAGGTSEANAPVEEQSAANRLAKIHDGADVWHRMGDVGYLDEQGRFWYCGRKSHRVTTAHGTLYTECCEAVLNVHPLVRRSALVGVGPADAQIPVAIIELAPSAGSDEQRLWETVRAELQPVCESFSTAPVRHLLRHPNLPVDVRHNSKINRELLARWAERRIHQ